MSGGERGGGGGEGRGEGSGLGAIAWVYTQNR